MKAYVAECFGTFCLVFLGCASVTVGGFGNLLPLGGLGIAISFGVAVIAMAYAIGPVSGAHLNPAVTAGVFLAGRMPFKDVLPYMVSQLAGAALAAASLWGMAKGSDAVAPISRAANGWDGAGLYPMPTAFALETLGTFIFVTVILGVTAPKHRTPLSGVVIGLTLTAIHLCLIPATGTSVNPARSIGPALFSGAREMNQLWLFIAAPFVGAAVAGVFAKTTLMERT
ncbi:MIP/aquaporin family protein [Nitratireductor kimnyeongensis]|uniref:MIP/aquaporin family protein n=1 Tax=Nitratireductor kimnyeongensis TaxID=430679 RepID=A0ABW0T4B7_9HYPH|nr:aquaporin [Nitratireductor kimnyeongensis]QZZ34778.1 aquaporin [Nitratireductor kimnyeongensis]